MFLITETTEDVKLLTEKREDGKKDYYLEGIFMQAEKTNRNGRQYSLPVLSNEVKRYNENFVQKNRSMGELGHPEGPTVNLERVSHLIKELRVDGNDIYGKAKLLDTPMGNIAKNLVNEGAKLGVSSRGMGSLKKNKEGVNEVQDDFTLATVDIVSDPSAPDAFVNGIMEGKEWVWNNGLLKPRVIEEMKTRIEKTPSRNLQEEILRCFNNLLNNQM